MNTNRRRFLRAASALLLFPAITSSRGSDAMSHPAKPKIVPAGAGQHFWALGVHVTVRVTSEDTNGAYSVFEDVVPPGGGPPLHSHSKEDETMLVLDGELEVTLAEQTVTVRPGTFVHMPRGVPHRFKNTTNASARMLLSYTPGGFEQWFTEIGTPATADATGPAPEVTREGIQRAVAAAERYGVHFAKPQKPANPGNTADREQP